MERCVILLRGEMSEWSNVPLSKSGRVNSPRGFESPSLRPNLEESHSGLVSTTGNRVRCIASVGSNPTSSAQTYNPLLS